MNLKESKSFCVIPAVYAELVSVKAGVSLLIITIFCFYSCSNKTFETKEQLIEYLTDPENGYYQNKQVNGYKFSLLYKPTDLLVEQEIGSTSRDTESSLEDRKEKVKVLREKYQNQMYFTLSMSRNNKELLSVTPNNRQEFGAMVNQLAFGMREKVFVYTQKKDTVEMLDYIYPRMYGMSKSTTMLFVYPKKEETLKEEYLNFTIHDLGTYTGEVKFKIKTKIIKKEPNLKFN